MVCAQGVHHPCLARKLGITEDELRIKTPAEIRTLINPHSPPGLHYLCSYCTNDIVPDPNEGQMNNKKDPKSKKTKEPQSLTNSKPGDIGTRGDVAHNTPSNEQRTVNDDSNNVGFGPPPNYLYSDEEEDSESEEVNSSHIALAPCCPPKLSSGCPDFSAHQSFRESSQKTHCGIPGRAQSPQPVTAWLSPWKIVSESAHRSLWQDYWRNGERSWRHLPRIRQGFQQRWLGNHAEKTQAPRHQGPARTMAHGRSTRPCTVGLVNGKKSTPQSVTSGVPNGSVLGPLLFLTLIGDIDENISHSFLSSFVDDTRIGRPNRSDTDIKLLQEDLDSVYQWSKENNMQFNSDKFEQKRYCTSSSREVQNGTAYLSNNGSVIEQKLHVRDLGFTLSSDATVSQHILNKTMSIRSQASWVLRTFKPGTQAPF